jgi:hypothetical protein
LSDNKREFFLSYSIRYLVIVGLSSVLLLLSGCSLSQTAQPAALSVIELPKALVESSGLVCVEQQFISFNDSGGLPILYRFDRKGQIQKQLKLSVRNNDWEAISSDGTYLYLADTGNNAGQRKSLLIYKIPLDWSGLKQPYKPEQIRIQLPVSDKLLPYQHDVDFEALVYQQQNLWLISKSWASQIPARYKLDPKSRQQELGQAESFATPGFLVTDAVFDKDLQQWWMVGYSDPHKAIWAYLSSAGLQPKIARYDLQMKLLETKALPTSGQVEGVCIDQDKQIWISEEGNKYSPARLIKTAFSSQ